jgi:hypothetical protein
MLQATGFQRRQHFDNYQQLMKIAMQAVLTHRDKGRCIGVPTLRGPIRSLALIQNTIHFCFSASDEKQKYLEQILHILSLHNYLN